jgi:hypothetical protein
MVVGAAAIVVAIFSLPVFLVRVTAAGGKSSGIGLGDGVTTGNSGLLKL